MSESLPDRASLKPTRDNGPLSRVGGVWASGANRLPVLGEMVREL